MTFEEPINPMRAMNMEWQERAEKTQALRFVGYAWDAILVFLFGWGAYTVLTDPFGLGLVGGFEGLLFTVGGLAVWALILGLFFRPVGRAAILKILALIRFIHKIARFVFGGPTRPDE